MQERHRFSNESVILRRVPRFTGGERMEKGRRYVVQILYSNPISTSDQVKLDPSIEVSDNRTFSSLASKRDGASEASTSSTMNLCSPIIQVTFFTILAELRPVAQRNSRHWENSFVASAKETNYKTNCMQYGLCSCVLDRNNWWSWFQVLHSNGWPSTRAWPEVLW